ncbi:hypothetical protein EHW67_04190 [Arenibacter aquaticus]|uniref:Uncharacterized protein n=1 Tax=Arenibacter aquaticus TaxID=2489054 RepID=A0A430K5P4_9FLAO|nr:hypothetical protein [Arenibacter aquaticus]RTE54372.1 hypothetical protein EHW67_04190 [Arenibacter aquaticus]
MKSILHKICALALAFLMLASTVSWTIEKHYCFGSLVDIAFFHEADSCGMEVDWVGDIVVKEDNSDTCCKDETISIEGTDNLRIPHYDFDLGQQVFWVADATYYLHLFEVNAERLVPPSGYPPPILVRDIYILDQVFLI